MAEFASPKQRVWFRLRPDVSRESAFDVAAGLLLREKPEYTAIRSFYLYPPGQGGSTGPRGVTFMWELEFQPDEAGGRDWGWGNEANEELAEKLRDRLADPAEASAIDDEENDWGRPRIRNRDLQITDVPAFDVSRLDRDDPQWDAVDHFAVSFDGYKFSGLDTELAFLAKGVREHVEAGGEVPITDLSWLRALLFIDQRRAHFTDSGEARWRREQAVYVGALLEAIRTAIADRPKQIATADLRAQHLRDVFDPERPNDAARINFAALWRFARTFDPCRYFGVDDIHGIVSSVAYGVRTEFALAGVIPHVGNLGLLRACLAYEERRWRAWDEDAPVAMGAEDRRYLAALVLAIRDRVK